jgi:large repetitive protein
VSITAGFASGEDVIAFTNAAGMGNIAGSYNAGTGVLSLSSAGATATLLQWRTALRAVTYGNTSDNPSTAARTVSFSVDDGTTTSNVVTSTVNVSAANDAPVLATGSTLGYTENDPATAINTVLTVNDADSATLATGTVSITANFASGQDVLAFTNAAGMGNITGSYNGGTGVLSLSSAGATATLLQWRAALRAVTYANSSDNPTTSARTVSFVVSDGALSSSALTATVNVSAVNDAPVLATGSTLNYTENDAATAINGALTVTDADNTTLTSGTVSITTNFASGEDVLAFTNLAGMGNIAGSWNGGTGVMTLTSAGATATVLQWRAALRAVTYANTSDTPSTAARTVSFAVNDGTIGSNVLTSTVNVAAANDAPVLATGSTLGYTENDPATAINTAITVTDLDHATLASGTVSITANYSSSQDVLAFTNAAGMGNIAGSWNSGTGVLSLTSAGPRPRRRSGRRRCAR